LPLRLQSCGPLHLPLRLQTPAAWDVQRLRQVLNKSASAPWQIF
jgi:hypothetical protein